MTSGQRTLLYYTSTAIILALLVIFVVEPLRLNIAQLRAEVDERVQRLALLQSDTTDTQHLKKTVEAAEERLANLEQSYVSRPEALSFITTIESIATDTGVIMDFHIPSTTEGTEAIQQVALDFNLVGTYQQCLSFLSRLEQQQWHLSIPSITLSYIGSEAGSDTMKLSFEAVSYWK